MTGNHMTTAEALRLKVEERIRALPLTLACSAAMQIGFLIGSVVTG